MEGRMGGWMCFRYFNSTTFEIFLAIIYSKSQVSFSQSIKQTCVHIRVTKFLT